MEIIIYDAKARQDEQSKQFLGNAVAALYFFHGTSLKVNFVLNNKIIRFKKNIYIYIYIILIFSVTKYTKIDYIQVIGEITSEVQEIKGNITGCTSTSLIVCCGSQKRYLLYSNSEQFNELSKSFPTKRRLTVEDNTIMDYEK